MDKQCNGDGVMDKYGDTFPCRRPATREYPYGDGKRSYCTKHYIECLESRVRSLEMQCELYRLEIMELKEPPHAD